MLHKKKAWLSPTLWELGERGLEQWEGEAVGKNELAYQEDALLPHSAC